MPIAATISPADFPPDPKPAYIVMSSTAKMPLSVTAPYRHVAVVLVSDPAIRPRMISSRARGVISLHTVWRNQHAKGTNCAYVRALRDAEKLAETLNKGLTN